MDTGKKSSMFQLLKELTTFSTPKQFTALLEELGQEKVVLLELSLKKSLSTQEDWQ